MLDTTILVSAFLTPRGLAARLLAEARQGRFTLLLCEEILVETQEVLLQRERLRRRYAYTDEQSIRFCHALRTAISLVRPVPDVRGVCRDPNDDYILACALGAHATYVVTWDPDLLELRAYQHVRIVNPATFLRLLITPEERPPH